MTPEDQNNNNDPNSFDNSNPPKGPLFDMPVMSNSTNVLPNSDTQTKDEGIRGIVILSAVLCLFLAPVGLIMSIILLVKALKAKRTVEAGTLVGGIMLAVLIILIVGRVFVDFARSPYREDRTVINGTYSMVVPALYDYQKCNTGDSNAIMVVFGGSGFPDCQLEKSPLEDRIFYYFTCTDNPELIKQLPDSGEKINYGGNEYTLDTLVGDNIVVHSLSTKNDKLGCELSALITRTDGVENNVKTFTVGRFEIFDEMAESFEIVRFGGE